MSLQETQGGTFLPAFFVEPVQLGEEFAKGELPLHMTYFPPVSAPLTPAHVARLKQYLNPMPPFIATVGESAKFGPAEDIHVRRIERSNELMAVHRRLLAAFVYLQHPTQYRMPYNPHITIAEDDTRVETGDKIEIAGLSVVEKVPLRNTWQVIAKIGLDYQNMQTDGRIIKARK